MLLGIMTSALMPPSGMTVKLTPVNVMCKPSFVPRMAVCTSASCPQAKSIGATYQERKILSIRGEEAHFSGVSTSFLQDSGGIAHMMSARSQRSCAAAALKRQAFVYPPMITKPQWWWRSLACAPYLIPLHEAWSIASHVYRLHPYMEKFDFLTDPFLITYSMIPRWLLMVTFFAVYYLVAKRKELPHFLRFHIFLALLMSQAVGALGMVCAWMPGLVFKGKMVYIWAAFAFVEMLTVIHCMQCSLRGMYSDVPFISDSTYINLSLR